MQNIDHLFVFIVLGSIDIILFILFESIFNRHNSAIKDLLENASMQTQDKAKGTQYRHAE